MLRYTLEEQMTFSGVIAVNNYNDNDENILA